MRMATLATASVVVVLAGAPALAGKLYRWRDADGVHYSNVPARVPPGAEEVTTTIGRIVAPGPPPATPAASAKALQARAERKAIRRRLAQIEQFYRGLRRRQEERLRRLYPNSTILADWQAGNRWLELKEEEALLRRRLECLGGSNGQGD